MLLAGMLLAANVSAASAESLDRADPSVRRLPGASSGGPASPAARRLGEIPLVIGAGLDLHAFAKHVPDDLALPPERARAGLAAGQRGRDAVTWLGHSSFLVRVGGANVLTDPVFAGRVFSAVLGPRRLVPLPLDVDDLPPIDAIVISHADYDHLDMPSLRRLARRFPGAAVVVPPRNGDLARRAGFADVRELPWYERTRVGGLTVQSLPALHDSRREPGNPFRRGWAGYGLEAGGRRVFFAGDTAYGDVFAGIRRRSGRFDVALVPIGAYEPRRVVRDVHADPEEAAAIARDLGARLAIGMHWGTFGLGPGPLTEPRERFLAAGGRGLDTRTLKVGETLALP